MKNLNAIITSANSYFAGIAQNHVKIQHTEEQKRYATMGIEEIISASFNLANLADAANPETERFILVFESLELDVAGPNFNKAQTNCTGAVWVLNFAERENHQEITRISAEAAKIGLEIASRIEHDRLQFALGQSEVEPFVKSFNPGSLNLNKVGPVGDQLHGYRMEFTVITTGALVHDSNNWL